MICKGVQDSRNLNPKPEGVGEGWSFRVLDLELLGGLGFRV